MKVTQPEGNYSDKYHNPSMIVKLIMRKYFRNLNCLLSDIEFQTVFEAGCGEGYISNHIYDYATFWGKKTEVSACDLSPNVIELAKNDFPHINFKVGTIYDLKEEDASYDLVIACEVLEHLEWPEKALQEIFRISKRYVLISVPNEPIWSVANFLRGKYLLSLGNTPGHIKHWTRNGITKLISSYGNNIKVKRPFPWIMILIEKKQL